jgi:RNA polymerase sigma-70 factor (ECF subfamily)
LVRLEEIIKGCVEGRRQAQEELYRMLAGKMFAVCLRYSRDHDEAKDNLQDGFIKVFGHIRQYRGAGSFEGWVRRIMVNTALQKYRGHYQLYALSDSETKAYNIPVENIMEMLGEKDLLEMIQGLPPRYKLVFNLYAIEGYSHKEISEQLNITEGTSKSNLSRARDILQERLKKIMEDKTSMIS